MEDYIIADKVLIKKFSSPRHEEHYKYLKKYDIPSKTSIKINQPFHKSLLRRTFDIENSKIINQTKNLLSSLVINTDYPSFQDISNKQKVFKYSAFIQKSQTKGINRIRKLKPDLLIQAIEPQRQQYDSNFDYICATNPSWTFVPYHKSAKSFRHKPQKKFQSYSSRINSQKNIKKNVKKDTSEGQQIMIQKTARKIYEQMCEKTGIGKICCESNSRYYPEELFNSTSQIFKKYHLDKDHHFQKFLQSIKNQQSKHKKNS